MTYRLPPAVGEALTNAWLVGPATIGMLVLIFGPVLAVAVLSFTDYQLGAQGFAWIGLENYTVLFTDPIGQRAVVNTLIYVAIVMPASMILALLVALGVHRVASWNATLAGVLRTAYFMPVAGTLVAMATVWQMLMHPNVGLFNQVLEVVGVPGQEWLSDRGIVLYS
ncbi:MAG: sugar ABC transporter permease, partial [Deltaproteobacteria bacterium]|nr:sugar ABC transporter permease [Deltaproteobacteria bacterium]